MMEVLSSCCPLDFTNTFSPLLADFNPDFLGAALCHGLLTQLPSSCLWHLVRRHVWKFSMSQLPSREERSTKSTSVAPQSILKLSQPTSAARLAEAHIQMHQLGKIFKFKKIFHQLTWCRGWARCRWSPSSSTSAGP